MTVTGIYKIECIDNRKIYIGLSINIHTRWWKHRYQLDSSGHCNQHLQSAWNKYGKEKFEFTVLEKCEKEMLIEREKYWINHYESLNPEKGYNIVGECGYDKNKKKEIKPKEEYKARPTRAILVLDTNNNIINKFTSAKQASEGLELNLCSIQTVLSTHSPNTNAKERMLSYKGYVFIYEDEYDENKSYIPNDNRIKKEKEVVERIYKLKEEKQIKRVPVRLVHENGEILEFTSAIEAIDKLNLVGSKAQKCLKDKKYKHRGYIFERILTNLGKV